MITCAIKIPDTSWERWIAPIGNTHRINAIECTADSLTKKGGIAEKLPQNDLSCCCIKDIIAPEAIEFYANAQDSNRFQEIKNSIYNMMLCAESLNTSLFTVNLLLDRTDFDSPERQIQCYAELIKTLLKAPLENDFKIGIQVRIPFPFPTSQEWHQALEICKLLDSPRVGLYVHFYPDEFAGNGTPEELLNLCDKRLLGICFHYDAKLGETLFDDEQVEWSNLLKNSDFQGKVVFAPSVSDDDDLDNVCQAIVSWSDFYTD